MKPALKALLRRWRNPAPIVEADEDKNGRKITHNSSDLKIPRGKGHALVIERVVASPGITLDELGVSLKRESHNVARTVSALVNDGFVFEHDGGYFAPHDLEDRLLDERRDTGAEQRERLQRERYERERQAQEKYLRLRKERTDRDRADRLKDVALDCGVGLTGIETDVEDPPSPSPVPLRRRPKQKG